MKTTKEMLKDELKAQKKWIEDSVEGREDCDFDDVIDEVLGIEIVRSLRGEFRGFELTLCIGCPNIFLSHHIAQAQAHLKGYWRSTEFELPLNEETSDMLLEYMEELADSYA